MENCLWIQLRYNTDNTYYDFIYIFTFVEKMYYKSEGNLYMRRHPNELVYHQDKKIKKL